MKHIRYNLSFFLVVLLSLYSFCSCITEDVYDNTNLGNFESAWKIFDEHYCFFDYKAQETGLNWDSVHSKYQERISSDMTQEQLFEILSNMMRELQDGHVNITSSFNTARYWDWFEKYPDNFSDSIQKIYLGTDYYMTQGIKYRILPNSIGYLYCGDFESNFGSGNLSAIFSHLAACSGLIVDVRNNEGGFLTAAQSLAECFTNEKIIGAYICHKTGKGHSDFSTPEAIKLTPAEGTRWQKKVVVLTNRKCYSAANTFVAYMKACPNVTIMGDRTGGGAGMPFNTELPNGWSVRFSACPLYDKDMNQIEMGIDPDVKVGMTAADMAREKDTMIETACQKLLDN